MRGNNSFIQVLFPTLPSGSGSPLFFWNSHTASSVSLPKEPSTFICAIIPFGMNSCPGFFPECSTSNRWSTVTKEPVSPNSSRGRNGVLLFGATIARGVETPASAAHVPPPTVVVRVYALKAPYSRLSCIIKLAIHWIHTRGGCKNTIHHQKSLQQRDISIHRS